MYKRFDGPESADQPAGSRLRSRRAAAQGRAKSAHLPRVLIRLPDLRPAPVAGQPSDTRSLYPGSRPAKPAAEQPAAVPVAPATPAVVSEPLVAQPPATPPGI